MDLGLKDKKVPITGGSKGIGLACAKAFIAEGAHVALVSRSQGRKRRMAVYNRIMSANSASERDSYKEAERPGAAAGRCGRASTYRGRRDPCRRDRSPSPRRTALRPAPPAPARRLAACDAVPHAPRIEKAGEKIEQDGLVLQGADLPSDGPFSSTVLPSGSVR